MTRKSKRELERALEGFGTQEELGWVEAMRWLEHVRENGADADSPAEYFGGPVDWEGWNDLVGSITEQAPELRDLNPAEIIGLRYCGEEIGEAVLERRRAKGL